MSPKAQCRILQLTIPIRITAAAVALAIAALLVWGILGGIGGIGSAIGAFTLTAWAVLVIKRIPKKKASLAEVYGHILQDVPRYAAALTDFLDVIDAVSEPCDCGGNHPSRFSATLGAHPDYAAIETEVDIYAIRRNCSMYVRNGEIGLNRKQRRHDRIVLVKRLATSAITPLVFTSTIPLRLSPDGSMEVIENEATDERPTWRSKFTVFGVQLFGGRKDGAAQMTYASVEQIEEAAAILRGFYGPAANAA